ncbi:MAG: hypothetical protein WCI73_16825, partial [Phycisphaerae bacterium]
GNLIGTSSHVYSSATGIKGDSYGPGNPLYNPAVSTTGDVQSFLNNITSSIYDATNNLNPSSPATPADGLVAQNYFLPGLLNFKRLTDGGAQTPNVLTPAQQAEQDYLTSSYNAIFTVNGTSATNNQTIGSGATYGALGTQSAFNGSIAITAKDNSGALLTNGTDGNKGNYLLGNFNQDGRRDYASVLESVNAALSLYAVDHAAATPGSNSAFTADGGVTNATVISSLSGTPGWATTANTKGDLIVLGDANGDGKFDGADIRFLATGAALADTLSSTHLGTDITTFADAVRNPNAVLRKNAALDAIRSATISSADTGQTFLRRSAESTLAQTNDASNSYLNAFNKADVNHDGVVDLNDAILVDNNNGKSYADLQTQLTTTYTLQGSTQVLNLVDVKLVDGSPVVGSADLAVSNSELDAGHNGKVIWYQDAVSKTGPGTITFARTAGAVAVDPAGKLQIQAGTVAVTGTVDPFTDSTTGQKLALSVGGGSSIAKL